MKKKAADHGGNIKKARGRRLSALLDVPLDMVADVPRMTLNDNRELAIENYKSIECYEPSEIRLRSKDYRITILGCGLQIIAITDEEMLINGEIQSLSLC
ncbi:MAG: sporulation protein YqfC [Ruminococcaceae bacterium]|nr:sporulation protein YqfC [Oscillospiraceae bacterium]